MFYRLGVTAWFRKLVAGCLAKEVWLAAMKKVCAWLKGFAAGSGGVTSCLVRKVCGRLKRFAAGYLVQEAYDRLLGLEGWVWGKYGLSNCMYERAVSLTGWLNREC